MRFQCNVLFLLVLYVILGLLGACTPISVPRGFNELKVIVDAVNQDDKRFIVAHEHFDAAQEALDSRDAELAQRHVELGLIEAGIAQTLVVQHQVIEEIEAESKKKLKLEMETSVWKSKLNALLLEQSNAALRAHIEKVIEADTLAAAAYEELHPTAWGEKKDAGERAQALLGKELLALATVRLAIAKVFVERQLIVQESLLLMEGLIELLRSSLKQKKMAEMYEFASKTLEQFQLRRDDAWLLHGDADYSTNEKRLGKILHESGINATPEDTGLCVPLAVEGIRITDDAEVMIKKIATLSKKYDNFYLMAVVSGTREAPVIAQRQRTVFEENIRNSLSKFDMSSSRYSIESFAGQRPLRLMAGTQPKAVLLFFPLP